MKSDIIEVEGTIQLKDRKWYQLFMKGWCRHTDGLNKPRWIRFNYPTSITTMLIILFAATNTVAQQNITEEAKSFIIDNNMNTSFYILVDMSVNSGDYRMRVINFATGETMYKAQTAKGSGTSGLPEFSNIKDSHTTALGKYKISNRAWSNWGINIKYWLDGLETSNSNARERVIVLHGWDLIEDARSSSTPQGWGCPAVSNNAMRFLDAKLKKEYIKDSSKRVLLWIYKS